MIVAILLLAELLLMLWLVWCLARRRPPGKPVSLGILTYKEERETEAAGLPTRRAGHLATGRVQSRGDDNA